MQILNHRIYGSGEPVIYILHGIFGMLDNWHYISGKLGETFTVVACDARNHGKSFHADTMNFEDMADDVANLMNSLGHHQIVLLGHSMGGKTAMAFAAKFPEKLEKLVVVDIANKSYPAGHKPYFEAFENIDFTTVNSRTEADLALAPYVSEPGVRQFLLKNLEPLSGGGYRPKFNLPVIEKFYEMVIGKIRLPKPAYSGPTLFISGKNSHYIQETDHLELLESFPNAQFSEVSNAGHWVHADNPAEFLDKLQTFIRS